MDNFKQSWYVIYTRPRHEKKVVEELEELKIETFLPQINTLRQWHDRRKYLKAPLFPSYVFVHLKVEQEYFKSLTSESVLYFVRTGKKIVPVSNSIIDDIKVIVNTGKDIEVS